MKLYPFQIDVLKELGYSQLSSVDKAELISLLNSCLELSSMGKQASFSKEHGFNRDADNENKEIDAIETKIIDFLKTLEQN